ncbi:MAG: hypothetical protein OHK0017_12420 [Patescibacteria group bacterium]
MTSASHKEKKKQINYPKQVAEILKLGVCTSVVLIAANFNQVFLKSPNIYVLDGGTYLANPESPENSTMAQAFVTNNGIFANSHFSDFLEFDSLTGQMGVDGNYYPDLKFSANQQPGTGSVWRNNLITTLFKPQTNFNTVEQLSRFIKLMQSRHPESIQVLTSFRAGEEIKATRSKIDNVNGRYLDLELKSQTMEFVGVDSKGRMIFLNKDNFFIPGSSGSALVGPENQLLGLYVGKNEALNFENTNKLVSNILSTEESYKGFISSFDQEKYLVELVENSRVYSSYQLEFLRLINFIYKNGLGSTFREAVIGIKTANSDQRETEIMNNLQRRILEVYTTSLNNSDAEFESYLTTHPEEVLTNLIHRYQYLIFEPVTQENLDNLKLR